MTWLRPDISGWLAARRKRIEDETITRAVLMGAEFRFENVSSKEWAMESYPSRWMYKAKIPNNGGDAVGETVYKCAQSYIFFVTRRDSA